MAQLGDHNQAGVSVEIDARPDPFLEVRVRDAGSEPGLTALCAGYEQGAWRSERLAKHLFEWLPEFALPWSERRQMHTGVAVKMLRNAANAVYRTEKFKKRGEFGELILHAVIRTEFGTDPAISKLFYKDAPNDTVKGFDCVHVVATDERFELWLGEAKFYGEPGDALRKAAASVHEHLERDYLRGEFVLIDNKIDNDWPHAERMRTLLNPNTSLDDIFDALHIPVLVTYDSEVMSAHTAVSDEFIAAFESEVNELASAFGKHTLAPKVVIELILMPLASKQKLIEELDKELKQWQAI